VLDAGGWLTLAAAACTMVNSARFGGKT